MKPEYDKNSVSEFSDTEFLYTLLSVASAAAAAAAVTIVVVVIAAAARAAGATAAAAALIGKEWKLTVHEKLCGIVGISAEACKRNNAVCLSLIHI